MDCAVSAFTSGSFGGTTVLNRPAPICALHPYGATLPPASQHTAQNVPVGCEWNDPYPVSKTDFAHALNLKTVDACKVNKRRRKRSLIHMQTLMEQGDPAERSRTEEVLYWRLLCGDKLIAYDRPHRCAHCCAAFAQLAYLRRHERVHAAHPAVPPAVPESNARAAATPTANGAQDGASSFAGQPDASALATQTESSAFEVQNGTSTFGESGTVSTFGVPAGSSTFGVPAGSSMFSVQADSTTLEMKSVLSTYGEKPVTINCGVQAGSSTFDLEAACSLGVQTELSMFRLSDTSRTLGVQTGSSTLVVGPGSNTFGTQTEKSSFCTEIRTTAVGTQTGSSTFGTQTSSRSLGTQTKSSTFSTQTGSSTFSTQTGSSTFTTPSRSSTLGTPTGSSTFGTLSGSSTFGTQSESSTISTQPRASTLGSQRGPSTFGTEPGSNTSSTQPGPNTFNTQAGSNTSGTQRGSNTFGTQPGWSTSYTLPVSSTFGTLPGSSTFGTQSGASTFCTQFGTSEFGSLLGSNIVRSQSASNTVHSQPQSSTFGIHRGSNTSGTQPGSKTFDTQPVSNTSGTQSGSSALIPQPGKSTLGTPSRASIFSTLHVSSTSCTVPVSNTFGTQHEASTFSTQSGASKCGSLSGSAKVRLQSGSSALAPQPGKGTLGTPSGASTFHAKGGSSTLDIQAGSSTPSARSSSSTRGTDNGSISNSGIVVSKSLDTRVITCGADAVSSAERVYAKSVSQDAQVSAGRNNAKAVSNGFSSHVACNAPNYKLELKTAPGAYEVNTVFSTIGATPSSCPHVSNTTSCTSNNKTPWTIPTAPTIKSQFCEQVPKPPSFETLIAGGKTNTSPNKLPITPNQAQRYTCQTTTQGPQVSKVIPNSDSRQGVGLNLKTSYSAGIGSNYVNVATDATRKNTKEPFRPQCGTDFDQSKRRVIRVQVTSPSTSGCSPPKRPAVFVPACQNSCSFTAEEALGQSSLLKGSSAAESAKAQPFACAVASQSPSRVLCSDFTPPTASQTDQKLGATPTAPSAPPAGAAKTNFARTAEVRAYQTPHSNHMNVGGHSILLAKAPAANAGPPNIFNGDLPSLSVCPNVNPEATVHASYACTTGKSTYRKLLPKPPAVGTHQEIMVEGDGGSGGCGGVTAVSEVALPTAPTASFSFRVVEAANVSEVVPIAPSSREPSWCKAALHIPTAVRPPFQKMIVSSESPSSKTINFQYRM